MTKTYKTNKLYASLYGRAAYEVWKTREAEIDALRVSGKYGKKDIIKIDELIDLDFDLLGYVDPNITVSTIRNGVQVEKKQLRLPQRLVGVLKCKNPRCITSVEQELPHIFKLTDRENMVYRCIYCESKAK